jgi:pimeloyl-ACP methyl ester carboxylesterase
MNHNQRLNAHPVKMTPTPMGQVAWRGAGAASAEVMVLLHGIGSGSASWLHQLDAATQGGLPLRVLAWDAPGYGASEALAPAQPTAGDYAQRMWAWLDALHVGAVHLVGHSLGALMAAAATRQQPGRVNSLTLLSPAQGYGSASAEVRQAKLQDRLQNLKTLGPEGMAQKRGAAMLSPQASAEQIGFITGVMAQINPAGYTQASHMLANCNLLADLKEVLCPIRVASGSADSITPPAGCQDVAETAKAPYQSLGTVGHACALEAGAAVTQLLAEAALSITSKGTP